MRRNLHGIQEEIARKVVLGRDNQRPPIARLHPWLDIRQPSTDEQRYDRCVLDQDGLGLVVEGYPIAQIRTRICSRDDLIERSVAIIVFVVATFTSEQRIEPVLWIRIVSTPTAKGKVILLGLVGGLIRLALHRVELNADVQVLL